MKDEGVEWGGGGKENGEEMGKGGVGRRRGGVRKGCERRGRMGWGGRGVKRRG